MDSQHLDTYLLIGSGVLVLAILAVRVSMTAWTVSRSTPSRVSSSDAQQESR